ncbi:LuxR family transcriptional regulator [Streptomyces sp. S.PB5]|uniref:ATP-binding protein n=1 Tax=Streptomyces sp. S.PB5 TaxID=3020844 RepID=UPI0025B223E0|nr:LuxR family transcriptional regulator [Streptomyces sp. S.PB5]MDN3029019.1 LuxR C-terminal-related transcriptional regulator [Streptomyces sp. S.PB5]
MAWNDAHQAPGPPIVGRHSEREAIGRLLDTVRDGLSAVLVLTGEAGIGKTRLLEYAADHAAELRVIRLTPVETETSLGFGALHRLLRPFLNRKDRLPGPQRAALDTALGLVAGPPADRYLVGLATLTLLSDATAEQPLLLLVDDAHWLDRESAEALAFTARRLHADSLGMIIALRDGPEDTGLFEALSVHCVTGLPEREAKSLLSFTTRRVDTAVAERIVVGTGGNPLALLELTDALAAEQLAGITPLPDPLPASRLLEGHFRRLVHAMPPETTTLLLLLATVPAGDTAMMWRAAGRLGLSARAVQPAIAAGILGRGTPPAFRHPLIRSTLYAAGPPEERRRAHAALAAACDPVRDADRRAWHLAEAAEGVDDDVADDLEAASERARSRGGYSQQALFLSRAAAFTKAPDTRAERLLDAAQAHLMSGDPSAAQTALDLASADIRGPVLGARELRIRATAQMFRIAVADVPAMLMAAVTRLGSRDPGLSWELLCEALHAALVAHDCTQGTSPAEVAAAAIAARQHTADGRDLLMEGLARRVAEGYEHGAPALRTALDGLRRGRTIRDARSPFAVMLSMACDDLWEVQAGRDLTDRLAAADRGTGALYALSITLLVQARYDLWDGRFGEAEVRYAEFDDIAADTGFPGGGDINRLHLFALTGHEEELRSAVRRTAEMGSLGHGVLQLLAQHALTLFELGQGRYGQALKHARTVFEKDPPACGNLILTQLVEACVRTGDRAGASEALARLEERAPLAATPWALGSLALGRALTADGDDAEKFYQESLDLLHQSPLALEQARARLLFGEWLRRCRRRSDARTQLRAAYESFDAFGATPYTERARLELLATGARARRRSEETRFDLTSRERQVASMAAAGLTNSEIATRLFVTASTVEFHLSRVFRKLGITSRRQIPRTIGEQGSATEG